MNLKKRITSMLNIDFKRMFTMPLVYIMLGISFIMPILILVMTSMMEGVSIDPVTGEETYIEGFKNVWQVIGSTSTSSSATSMDITSMCNINMLYFVVVILVSLFISSDFSSGYAKNLFTYRAKKQEYVISKTVVCFVSGALMFIAYFIGALIGGKIAGLPFIMEGFNTFNLIMSMLSKIFIILIFVSISTLANTYSKDKAWLGIIISLGGSMLLFTMVPLITPLDSNAINLIMTIVGGILFSVGLGALSNLVLNKTSIL